MTAAPLPDQEPTCPPGYTACQGIQPWRGITDLPRVQPRLRIAIAGAGPSLVGADLTSYHDVIAINRAVRQITNGWWAFGDLTQLADYQPGRGVALFTTFANFYACPNIRGVESLTGVRFLPYEKCGWQPQDGCFSIIAALMLAWRLGAASIDLLGCDWEGVNDFDGATPRAYRTPLRWEIERFQVACVVEILARYGVTCQRLSATGEALPLRDERMRDVPTDDLWRLEYLAKRDRVLHDSKHVKGQEYRRAKTATIAALRNDPIEVRAYRIPEAGLLYPAGTVELHPVQRE